MIAGWLGSEFAAFDRRVQKLDKEYDDTESVHQEVDEHLEIGLTRPDESSLAYPLSGQFLRRMVERTQHIPNRKTILKKNRIYINTIA